MEFEVRDWKESLEYMVEFKCRTPFSDNLTSYIQNRSMLYIAHCHYTIIYKVMVCFVVTIAEI